MLHIYAFWLIVLFFKLICGNLIFMQKYSEVETGASKTALRIKVLALKPNDQSFSPRIHMVEEKNWFL